MPFFATVSSADVAGGAKYGGSCPKEQTKVAAHGGRRGARPQAERVRPLKVASNVS